MTANNLSEIAVDLITAQIKANIPDALAEVRTSRDDAYVTTEPPLSYFDYPHAYAYRSPAIFVIVENIDFRLDRGPNCISAKLKVNVNVVVEDKDMSRLTAKAYRYQAALNRVLQQTRLTSSDNSVVYIVKVIRAEYSPIYTNAQAAGDPTGVFRKEVLLECEVENYENF
jgi:hypothetical protein